jgi:hypothetical protein
MWGIKKSHYKFAHGILDFCACVQIIKGAREFTA